MKATHPRKIPFASLAKQCKTVTYVGHRTAGIDKFIFAIAQVPLFGVSEREISVIFVVMTVVKDLDLRFLDRCLSRLGIGEPNLGLHLEAFGFHRTADGEQFT